MSSGKITQVVGPVVDVAFAVDDKLPEINNALVVYKKDQSKQKVVLEVALELGHGIVRTIAMESTDGLTRGMEVLDTGRPISVPVGKETLGRVFNVLGDTIDLEEPFAEEAQREPIHKKAPTFDELSTSTEILETGIKVIDLLAPSEGRKGWTLWRCRGWKNRPDSGIDSQYRSRARRDFSLYWRW